MALSANTAWEVRPTNGVDTNGGGFVAGASGTDWSQQNAAQYALTGVTTAAANAILLTASAAADMVGNIAQITGGTNFITGFYQIISVVVGVSITVDRNATSAAGAAGVVNIGGAIATLATLASVMVTSNKAFLKAESGFSSTATITFGAAGVSPTAAGMPTRLIGYTTSRTDRGKATLTLSTNTGLTGISLTNRGWILENIIVDCNNLGTSTAFSLPQLTQIVDCVAKNFKTAGIVFNSTFSIALRCEVTGGGSAATAAINCIATGAPTITQCNIHDNACIGINNPNDGTVSFNLITNNSGASTDGIQLVNGTTGVIFNNTIYQSGRSGIRWATGSPLSSTIIRNNILAKNGAFGIDFNTAGWCATILWDGNAYWSNTSGNRNDMDDTSTNPINGVSPYVNTLDVTLSVDPFTNAAGGDFTLNNNSTGGAACRSAGSPSTFPGVTGTPGHIDQGVFQHADPSINRSLVIQNIGTY